MTTVNFYAQTIPDSQTGVVNFYKQDPDNPSNYILANTVTTTSNGTFYISDKYNGFEAFEYSVDGGQKVSVGDKNASDGYYNGGEGITYSTSLDIYYNRLTYPLAFMNGAYFDGYGDDGGNRTEVVSGEFKTVNDITYGADISSYAKGGANYYEPTNPNGYEGYTFAGWYLDEQCTEEAKFDTMPEGGLTVYAKWIRTQYRVFLHSNVPTSDNTLSWGND